MVPCVCVCGGGRALSILELNYSHSDNQNNSSGIFFRCGSETLLTVRAVICFDTRHCGLMDWADLRLLKPHIGLT